MMEVNADLDRVFEYLLPLSLSQSQQRHEHLTQLCPLQATCVFLMKNFRVRVDILV